MTIRTSSLKTTTRLARNGLATAGLMFATGPTAEARFLLPDADQIDQEERLSTETYNDKISYRFPAAWDQIWAEKDAGFRVTAGSLNVNRFDYNEEIKFHVYSDSPVSFAFDQTRREDVLKTDFSQVFRIDWRTLFDIQLSLLGEGGAKKEYGDLGMAVGYRPDKHRFVELYYWSVDHFYDTKKNEVSDSRSRSPSAVGFKARWVEPDLISFDFDYQYDKPMRWDRVSSGYEYDHWRRTVDFRLGAGKASSISGYLSGHSEAKGEGKLFYLDDDLTHEKTLDRTVGDYEAAVVHTLGDTRVTTGAQVILRDASYRHEAATGVTEDMLVEENGPDSSRRRETGFFTTGYFKGGSIVNYQFGLFGNSVAIDEADREYRTTEVKLQTAWDFVISEHGRIFANLTWDLDELKNNFPYTEEGFKPWGGGNIQFLAVF